MGRRHIAVVVCGLSVAPAAQSTADPQHHPVAEQAADTRSHLWESAIDPQRAPYDQLVVEGARQIQRRTKEAARLAVKALDDAIARIPSEGRAHALRGQAHLMLENWAECASDLANARRIATTAEREHSRSSVTAVALAYSRHGPDLGAVWASPDEARTTDLGICQGRAGQFFDAEQTLAEAASRTLRSETWLRLGEVRIALGKLDAAIEALETALEKQDAFRPFVEWLLAIAHDRAGRTSDAEHHAALALAYDSTFNSLVAPRFPWLRIGDRDYALGLAHQASGLAEYALGHFRRFLAIVPQSPWRHRAEQHLRELSVLDLPQWLQRDPTSSAPVDLTAIKPLVRRAMAALEGCTANQATEVFTIAITRTGPRTPVPSTGSQATAAFGTESGSTDDQTERTAGLHETTRRCLERIADRIPLPAPTKPATWYRVRFAVVAPSAR